MNARLNNDIKAGIFGRTGNWPFDLYGRGIRSLTSSTRRDARDRRAHGAAFETQSPIQSRHFARLTEDHRHWLHAHAELGGLR